MSKFIFSCLGGIIWGFFLACSSAFAFPLDFNTIRMGSDNRAALVIGGIQGDEPGGFSAATLLATRYEIHKGALWVVPNLNFPSIIKRSRGLYGDMNRKFLHMESDDPEFDTVRRIQELISEPNVSLVLNLHDGSGYYRPEHEDKLKNPQRWGQSIIIDQESMAGDVFMGNLASEAAQAAKEVDPYLLEPMHAIHVHNTRTALGNKEMEKSLSYYAVRKGKAAFGLEASKEMPVAERAYYHLLMVEAFLKMAGIEFKRDFELTPAGVERALGEHIGVSFSGNRIFLPLEDVRPAINSLPLARDSIDTVITSKPIMAVLPCEDGDKFFCIHYGNRMVARISPEWRETDENVDAMEISVDGVDKLAPFGEIIDVTEMALVKKKPGYRVNAIGFDKGIKDESGFPLRYRDFQSRFSLDRAGRIFRVEVYKGHRFAGMFLLRFAKNGKPVRAAQMPGCAGKESALGY